MARINLNIEAESGTELRDLLRQMLGTQAHAYEFQPTESDLDKVITDLPPVATDAETKKRRGRPAKIVDEPVATKAEDVIEQVNDPVEAEKKAVGKVISDEEAKAATPRTVDETKAKLLALSEKTTPTSARDFMIEVTGGSQRNTDVPDWMRGAFYDRLVAKLEG